MSVKAVSYNEVSGARSAAYLSMWSALNWFVAENQRSEPAEFGSLSERLTAAGAMFHRAEELLAGERGQKATIESDLIRDHREFQRRLDELQTGSVCEDLKEYSIRLRDEGLRLSHEAVSFARKSVVK